MPSIAIMGDTHIPSRASELPDWVRSAVRDADLTIHMGDFDSAEAYEEIGRLADALYAVIGNMDPGLALPAVETVEVDQVSFVVTHGTGPLDSYRDRVRVTALDHAADPVAVAGHTHEVIDESIDGVRLLNPGSATGAAPAARATMFLARIDGDDLEVELLDG